MTTLGFLKVKHSIAVIGRALDRAIRRLETPRADYSKRVEPGFGGPSGAQARHRGATATLLAVDGLTMEANAAALKAIAGFHPDDTDAASDLRTLAGATAAATRDYLAVAADELELDSPLEGREPVWGGALAHRFEAVTVAANALLERGSSGRKKSARTKRAD